MADPFVVSALKSKRAELAGKIESYQAEIKQMVVELGHVEATLRIFEPTIDFRELRPRKPKVAVRATRGEMTRIIFAALKGGTKPLSTRELADLIMAERELDVNDGPLRRMITKRVGAILRYMERERGTVRSKPMGRGQYNLWELVR